MAHGAGHLAQAVDRPKGHLGAAEDSGSKKKAEKADPGQQILEELKNEEDIPYVRSA